MPQHDLVINNASGAAVRADLNDALAALGSAMKGPNAPPAPLAGMLWLDDDTPSATVWTLKLYDGADWLSLGTFNVSTNAFTPANALPLSGGTLTGQLLAPSGSVNAPAYSFSGDTDTGIYGPAAGEIAATINGADAYRMRASGTRHHFLGADGATIHLISGTTRGIRVSTDTSNAYLDAVDNTGGASYQPLALRCLDISLSAGSSPVERMRIPATGAITMVGPVNVTSGDLDVAGNLRFNSGYGSAGIAYGVRAWASVTIAAGVPTMDANGNFTSITDNGVGDFTFNFSNNMPDTHYAITGSAVGLNNTAGVQPGLAVNTANSQPLLKSTSQVRIGLYRLDANAYADAATFSIMVVR